MKIRPRFILASASTIRAALLTSAGVDVEVLPARIDEEALRAAAEAEGAAPHDIAGMLAEAKARKISRRAPEALVIGCDQILECDGRIYGKAADPAAADEQLASLAGRTHHLHSAAVVCQGGEPVWRHVGHARLTMRDVSAAYRADYIARNWQDIRHSVGCYQIEGEGVRLMSRIEGDHFTILGLPLIPLLTWLGIRGDIAT